jgi:hypothetical protein
MIGNSLLLEPEAGSQGKTQKGGLRLGLFPLLARSGWERTRWIRGIAGWIEGGKRVIEGEVELLQVVLLLVAVGVVL